MPERIPKYIALHQKLRTAILSHQYFPGTLLPSEQELMAKYSVSRTTVRRVMAMLKEESLVEIRQGRGTMVKSVPLSDTTNDPFRVKTSSFVSSRFTTDGPHTSSIQGSVIDRLPADGEVADALCLEPGTEVYRLQRMKMVDGTVFAMATSYVRQDMAPNLEQFSGQIFYLYRFLSEHYGIEYETGSELISVEKAKFVESRLLNIGIGEPVLVSRRTVRFHGVPFEYGVSLSRADLTEIVIESENPMPTTYY